MDLDAFQREERNIQFRRDLMQVPGGIDWLLHIFSWVSAWRQELSACPTSCGSPYTIAVGDKCHKCKSSTAVVE